MSSIRVMNKVSKSIFSRKVSEKMSFACNIIKNHLVELDFNVLTHITPRNKNSELIKLIRFYMVVPEAGLLIDRKCNFERTRIVNDDQSQKLILTL